MFGVDASCLLQSLAKIRIRVGWWVCSTNWGSGVGMSGAAGTVDTSERWMADAMQAVGPLHTCCPPVLAAIYSSGCLAMPSAAGLCSASLVCVAAVGGR